MKYQNLTPTLRQGKTKSGLTKQGSKQGSDLVVAGASIKEGKENQTYSDGLNKASDFYSNTVHHVTKKTTHY